MVVALRGACADSCVESWVSLEDATLEIRVSIEGWIECSARKWGWISWIMKSRRKN